MIVELENYTHTHIYIYIYISHTLTLCWCAKCTCPNRKTIICNKMYITNYINLSYSLIFNILTSLVNTIIHLSFTKCHWHDLDHWRLQEFFWGWSLRNLNYTNLVKKELHTLTKKRKKKKHTHTHIHTHANK